MQGGKNLRDLCGQRFGRLTVVERIENRIYPNGKMKARWRCLCDCGQKLDTLGNAITQGFTSSCGCLKRELLSAKTWRGYKEISGVYWGRTQDGAKSRNLSWDITFEYVWRLFLKQKRLCALSKLPIHFERNFKKNGLAQTASLDRVDSKSGYIKGNVQWLHKDVNRLKWDLDTNRLYELCELIIKNKSENH